MEDKEKVAGPFRDPRINENNNLCIFEYLLGKYYVSNLKKCYRVMLRESMQKDAW